MGGRWRTGWRTDCLGSIPYALELISRHRPHPQHIQRRRKRISSSPDGRPHLHSRDPEGFFIAYRVYRLQRWMRGDGYGGCGRKGEVGGELEGIGLEWRAGGG